MEGERPAQRYRCKHCGFEQKSRATTRIKCHRCKKTYKPHGHEAPPHSKDNPFFLSFSADTEDEEESTA